MAISRLASDATILKVLHGRKQEWEAQRAADKAKLDHQRNLTREALAKSEEYLESAIFYEGKIGSFSYQSATYILIVICVLGSLSLLYTHWLKRNLALQLAHQLQKEQRIQRRLSRQQLYQETVDITPLSVGWRPCRPAITSA